MENINLNRIYSILVDIIISTFVGILVLSLFNLEKDIQLGKFTLFGQDIKYGFSFQIIIVLGYFIAFDFLNNGKTFGKLIFSILVVDSSTLTQLSLSSRIKRTFLKILGIIIFPFSLIMFLINSDFTIQDKIMKTTTVRK